MAVEYRDRALVLAEQRGQTMSDFVESLIVKAVDEADQSDAPKRPDRR